ncbi:ankyrin repeat domain-containing protein [Leptospira idonii]|uniref:Ankyrin repeat domain-containing protein n=1 Tax=Leptospira idonii TaxID=1193500 RepID=A0A4R9M409_9LEPT|nr:ankyrin repeat domain-containing protein [Leptospira idonii]TGN20009.1 ankyrin repeat domain-containing protein [Leptospira idonii]
MMQLISNFFTKIRNEVRYRNLVRSLAAEDKLQFQKDLDLLRKEPNFLASANVLLGIVCAESNDIYFLETLLEAGLNPNVPNESGIYPIHTAVENGKLDAVKILLSHGADPDAEDPRGVTPLHIANSYDGLGEVSDLLLANGANPNKRDKIGKRYLM